MAVGFAPGNRLPAGRAAPHRRGAARRAIADGNRTWILVFLVLFVHSLPEGFAIGTAYASTTAGLGLFIVVAIAIQNVPEGTSTAIPMAAAGYGAWAQFWAAVLTSVPQPIGAVIAYLLVEQISALLPVSFAFAAGAMLALVVVSVFPDAVRDAASRRVHRHGARRAPSCSPSAPFSESEAPAAGRRRAKVGRMDDATLRDQIEELVAEERRLLERVGRQGPRRRTPRSGSRRSRSISTDAGICCGSARLTRSSGSTPTTPRSATRTPSRATSSSAAGRLRGARRNFSEATD